MGAELLHTDGRTDMKNQIIAFRNFAKAPKNDSSAAMFMRIGGFSLSVSPVHLENMVCCFLNNAISTAACRLHRVRRYVKTS